MRPLPGRSWRGAVLLLALVGCGGHVLPQIRSDADRMAVARKLHDEGECGDAIELFKTYIAENAGARDVDDAIYLLGDCNLRIKEWTQAAAEFERLLRDYPESDSAGAASFRLGEAYFGQARKPDFDQEYTRKALDQWQSYLANYPDHWLRGQAESKVLEARTRLAKKLLANGNLYLKLKLPKPAKVYFQRIVDEFSDTPMVSEAMLGLAQADIRLGRREEALQQLREIETRYHGQSVASRAARERSRLERRS